MIHGQYSVLNKSPGKFITGAAFAQAHCSLNKPGQKRNVFLTDQGQNFSKQMSIPQGRTPPHSWIMPQSAGGMASFSTVAGSGSLSSANLAGGLNGTADLTGTGTISSANMALIMSAVATLSGRGELTYAISGAQSHWKFENSLEDCIGHRTLGGTSVTYATGKIGDSAVVVPDGWALTYTSDDYDYQASSCTISAWVKFAVGGTATIEFTDGSAAWSIAVSSTGVTFSADMGGAAVTVTDSVTLSAATPIFVSFRFNGTTIYGNVNDRTKVSAACTTLGNHSGGDLSLSSVGADCTFDNLLTYQSSLTDNQINTILTNSIPNIAGILSAAATLAGSGSLTGALGALASAVATIAGTGTCSADIYAIGSISADVTPFTTLSPENLANSVLNSTLEGNLSVADAIRILLSIAAGKTDITGSTVTFRDTTDARDRVVANMTGSERTTVTLDPTQT